MGKDKITVATKKAAARARTGASKPKKNAASVSKKATSTTDASNKNRKSKAKKGPSSGSKRKSKLASPPFALVENPEETSVSTTMTTATKTSSAASFDESLEGVARLLEGRKNIVVLVGAGLSTSVGIPDFRSKDGGLYNSLDTEAMGLSCPEELFCISFFEENPRPFFQFARNLYFPLGEDQRVEPSDGHKILALLEEKKMLLRIYSQNIDGLEAAAGVSNKKIVYAHGNLGFAKCMRCGKKVTSEEILSAIKKGTVPRCQVPRKKPSSSLSSTSSATASAAAITTSSNSSVSSNSPTGSSRGERNNQSLAEPSLTRATRKRPRPVTSLFTLSEDASSNNMDDEKNDIENNVDLNLFCGGVLKPGVTFFGESLNDTVGKKIESDRTKADALVVIGTSLSVAPISKVIGYMPSNIPRILINRTIVRPLSSTSTEESATSDHDNAGEEADFRDNYAFDAYLLGNCDDVTRSLARKMFRSSGNDSANGGAQPIKREEETKRRKTNSNAMMHDLQTSGALLSNVLKGKEENWKAEDWSAVDVPPERVLLFPGASNNDSSAAKVEYREIAHCDGCTKRIQGVVKKCMNCFDYDLCAKCFPTLSKNHFNGSHRFHSENATT